MHRNRWCAENNDVFGPHLQAVICTIHFVTNILRWNPKTEQISGPLNVYLTTVFFHSFELLTQLYIDINDFVVTTLRPRQDSRHFCRRHFQMQFRHRKCFNFIKNSLNVIPKGPMDNNSSFVQVMAWRRTGDKPLHKPMMAEFNDAYMRHQASMSQHIKALWRVHTTVSVQLIIFSLLVPKSLSETLLNHDIKDEISVYLASRCKHFFYQNAFEISDSKIKI